MRKLAYEKYIDLIPRTVAKDFPELPSGVRYSHKSDDKVTVVVDMNTITVQNALKALLDLFNVEDIDVYDTELESIIRHIYEGNPSRV